MRPSSCRTAAVTADVLRAENNAVRRNGWRIGTHFANLKVVQVFISWYGILPWCYLRLFFNQLEGKKLVLDEIKTNSSSIAFNGEDGAFSFSMRRLCQFVSRKINKEKESSWLARKRKDDDRTMQNYQQRSSTLLARRISLQELEFYATATASNGNNNNLFLFCSSSLYFTSVNSNLMKMSKPSSYYTFWGKRFQFWQITAACFTWRFTECKLNFLLFKIFL